MTRWEYRTIAVGANAASVLLTEAGQEGWELCGVEPDPLFAGGVSMFWLKRPIPEPPPRESHLCVQCPHHREWTCGDSTCTLPYEFPCLLHSENTTDPYRDVPPPRGVSGRQAAAAYDGREQP